ncbi:UNVERIFIED_CONTAM: hypothetical protein Sradi_2077500 [Sesamum radiatum]|uniref:Reverse transcriptase zinc-binding domain-containing protein n=1 Tax=Sesamum radiatum TaxID=300843 RepID=A0AAW2TIH6_SESRA
MGPQAVLRACLAVNTSKSSILTAGIVNNNLDGIVARMEFTKGEMLVRSVIQGVECFSLLAAVVDKIHRLSRNFLWNSKRTLVAWEEICHPKEESGLGIQHIQSWNVALLARVLWNIHRRRQIRCRFISAFGTSEATIQCMADWSNTKGLETSKAYEYFKPKLTRQLWKAAIWKAFIPLKYSFILWLGLRSRLATRNRLAFLQDEHSCSLCINTLESASHLFFACPFSAYVWSHIRQWLDINRCMSTLASAVKWLKKEKTGSSVQNKARALALACTIYSLWRH